MAGQNKLRKAANGPVFQFMPCLVICNSLSAEVMAKLMTRNNDSTKKAMPKRNWREKRRVRESQSEIWKVRESQSEKWYGCKIDGVCWLTSKGRNRRAILENQLFSILSARRVAWPMTLCKRESKKKREGESQTSAKFFASRHTSIAPTYRSSCSSRSRRRRSPALMVLPRLLYLRRMVCSQNGRKGEHGEHEKNTLRYEK